MSGVLQRMPPLLKQERARARAQVARWRLAGLCNRCGSARAPGSVLCVADLETRRKQQRERHALEKELDRFALQKAREL